MGIKTLFFSFLLLHPALYPFSCSSLLKKFVFNFTHSRLEVISERIALELSEANIGDFKINKKKVLDFLQQTREKFPLENNVREVNLDQYRKVWKKILKELTNLHPKTLTDFGLAQKEKEISIEKIKILGTLLNEMTSTELAILSPERDIREEISQRYISDKERSKKQFDQDILPTLVNELVPYLSKAEGWESLFDVYAADNQLPQKTREAFSNALKKVYAQNPKRVRREGTKAWINWGTRNYQKWTRNYRPAPKPIKGIDYYQVLGINRNATLPEIKNAYRRIAKENHPDIYPNDFSKIQKFKEATEAFDTLGDEKKRSKYDGLSVNH